MDGGEGHDGALTVGSRLTRCTISNRSYMLKGSGPVRMTQFTVYHNTLPRGELLRLQWFVQLMTPFLVGVRVCRDVTGTEITNAKSSLLSMKADPVPQFFCTCFLCKRSKYIIQSLLRMRQFSSHDFRDPHRHRSYHIRMMAVCNIKIDQMVSYVWIPRSKGRE